MPQVKTAPKRSKKAPRAKAAPKAKRASKARKAPTAKTAHDVIAEHFIPGERKEEFDARVTALLAHNQLLEAIEEGLKARSMNKTELAAIAGLNASSLRRMLTSKTANPTTNNAFRLFAALGIKLDATLPSGNRIEIV